MTVHDLEFLSLLRCPRTGDSLRVEESALVSERGDWMYPIRDGVCVLISEAAQAPVQPEKP